MNKYKVICYPSDNSYELEIEANSIEEAIKEAEHYANQDCGFYASESDVELIEEDDDGEETFKCSYCGVEYKTIEIAYDCCFSEKNPELNEVEDI